MRPRITATKGTPMKTRQEIKALAKHAMGEQRSTAIFILLVVTLASLASGGLDRIVLNNAGWVVSVPVFWVGMILLYVLVVNSCGQYIAIYMHRPASVSALFAGFKVNFLRKAGGSMWMTLWLFLWSLPAIVAVLAALVMFTRTIAYQPYYLITAEAFWAGGTAILIFISIPFAVLGIVKYFSYYFTLYILADCPEVPATGALKVSMHITKGYKANIFIFVLSWLGWLLLSALTFGILYIVYVGPYWSTADAGLYIEMRNKALADGRIKPQDLGWEDHRPVPPNPRLEMQDNYIM